MSLQHHFFHNLGKFLTQALPILYPSSDMIYLKAQEKSAGNKFQAAKLMASTTHEGSRLKVYSLLGFLVQLWTLGMNFSQSLLGAPNWVLKTSHFDFIVGITIPNFNKRYEMDRLVIDPMCMRMWRQACPVTLLQMPSARIDRPRI